MITFRPVDAPLVPPLQLPSDQSVQLHHGVIIIFSHVLSRKCSVQKISLWVYRFLMVQIRSFCLISLGRSQEGNKHKRFWCFLQLTATFCSSENKSYQLLILTKLKKSKHLANWILCSRITVANDFLLIFVKETEHSKTAAQGITSEGQI